MWFHRFGVFLKHSLFTHRALFDQCAMMGLYVCVLASAWLNGFFYLNLGLLFLFESTAGDWDCVAAVERLQALHYSVDFIFLSFGIIGFIVEL